MSIIKGERAKVVTLFGGVTIPSGARSFGAYLARPDLRGEWPTVVVVAVLVTSPVKDLCRRLARQGLAVIAPEDAAAAREATVEFIVNPTADWSSAEHGFGLLGLGPGGAAAQAEMASRELAGALALVSATPDPSSLGRIGGRPVLGISGRLDEAVPSETIAAARAAAPQTEWVVYGALGGDFWDDAAPGWDPEAADDSFVRLSEFLRRHLPSAPK